MSLATVISDNNDYNQFYLPSCNNRLLPLIRQFFLISNRMNVCGLQTVIFYPPLGSILPKFDHFVNCPRPSVTSSPVSSLFYTLYKSLQYKSLWVSSQDWLLDLMIQPRVGPNLKSFICYCIQLLSLSAA
jgi:hypothetical protein